MSSSGWAIWIAAAIIASGGVALLAAPSEFTDNSPQALEFATDRVAPDGWMDAAVTRFDLARLPAPTGSGATEAAYNPAEALRAWALVGVVETDGEALALVARGRLTRTLRTGDVLEGFTLQSLSPQDAVFVRDGQEERLHLGVGAQDLLAHTDHANDTDENAPDGQSRAE